VAVLIEGCWPPSSRGSPCRRRMSADFALRDTIIV
jgi:hypothetical protein